MRASRFPLVVPLALGPLVACNIFLTIERCESNGDCPVRYTCDPVGGYCVAPAAPADRELPTPDAPDVPPDDDDAEAGPSRPCDPTSPFGEPELVPGLEDVVVSSARFLPDERTVVIASTFGCVDEHCYDLLVASRDSADGRFRVVGPLGGVNSQAAAEYWPTLSSDGLVLFFESSRSLTKPDGAYTNDRSRIWSASRVSPIAEFSEPRIQSIFATDGFEVAPFLHPSGRTLYFSSASRGDAGTGYDIYRADLDPLGLATEVRAVSGVNSPLNESMPVVTADDRTLFFARELASGWTIFHASRAIPGDPFIAPSAVPELQRPYVQFPSWVSNDRCRLYLISTKPLPPSMQDGPARVRVAKRTLP